MCASGISAEYEGPVSLLSGEREAFDSSQSLYCAPGKVFTSVID